MTANMTTPARPRLRQRILAGFVVLALLCSLLFALLNLLFMYVTEDSILDRQLQAEVARQQQLSQPAAPPYAYLKLYQQTSALPADLQAVYQGAARGEFRGEAGRHYHFRQFHHPALPQPLYLVAEVSSQLVVRPLLQQMLLIYGVVCLAFLALALLLGWYLARRVAAPLTELANVVQQQPLPMPFAQRFTDAEVYALASRLEQSLLQLQQYAERERQFSRTASHELRTPLSVIQTSCELLQLSAHDEVSCRRLSQIQQASQQMQQLIETLLSLARVTPPASSIDWPSLLQHCWQRQQQWQPRPALTLALSEDSAGEHGDVSHGAIGWQLPAEPLRLLLDNLLQNVLRHSADGCCQVLISPTLVQLSNPIPPLSAASEALPDGLHGFGSDIASRLAQQCGLQLQQQVMGNHWQLALRRLPAATASSTTSAGAALMRQL